MSFVPIALAALAFAPLPARADPMQSVTLNVPLDITWRCYLSRHNSKKYCELSGYATSRGLKVETDNCRYAGSMKK